MTTVPLPLHGLVLVPFPAVAYPVAALVLVVAAFWAFGIVRWRRGFVAPKSRDLPLVSVLVAGRNEESYLRGCLDSILRSDYPHDKLEVCFVDDHSDDHTYAVASALAEGSSGRLRVFSAPPLQQGHSPKKSALAFGVQHSSGDILLFTDADTEVPPGWIRSIASAYDSQVGAVAGAAMPGASQGLHRRLYRLERFMAAFTSASAIGHGSPASVTGQNFSFRRSAFEDVGGYAHPGTASGDDDLMAQAIARRGWKVKFCAAPESVVADLRPPEMRSHLASTSRHQSVVRFYPLHWRAAYLVTILAGWSLMLGCVFSLFHREYLPMAAAVLGLKFLMDAAGTRIFSRRLCIRLKLSEFLLAETMLPLYLMARPLMAFRSSFVWRGRTHRTLHRPAADVLP